LAGKFSLLEQERALGGALYVVRPMYVLRQMPLVYGRCMKLDVPEPEMPLKQKTDALAAVHAVPGLSCKHPRGIGRGAGSPTAPIRMTNNK
jgi:hypothetical protein